MSIRWRQTMTIAQVCLNQLRVAYTNSIVQQCNAALHVAAAEGHVGAVRVLVGAIEQGTEKWIDAKDRWGKTAEDEAAEHKHTDVVELLQRALKAAPSADELRAVDVGALEPQGADAPWLRTMLADIVPGHALDERCRRVLGELERALDGAATADALFAALGLRDDVLERYASPDAYLEAVFAQAAAIKAENK